MEEEETPPRPKERPIVAIIVVCLLLGITYGLVKRAISPRMFEASLVLTPDDSPDHRPALWESDDLYLETAKASDLSELFGLSEKHLFESLELMTRITFEGDQVLITMQDQSKKRLAIAVPEYPLAYQRLVEEGREERLKEKIETIDLKLPDQEREVFLRREELEIALLEVGASAKEQPLLSREAFEEFWTKLPESERTSKDGLARKVGEARQGYDNSLARLTALKEQRQEAQEQLENWQPPGIESGQITFKEESFWEYPVFLLSFILGGSIVFTGLVLILAYLFLWRGVSGDEPTAEPPHDDPADVW